MYQRGEVVKCSHCGKYRLKDEDCAVCGKEPRPNTIRIEVDVVKRWGTRLYAIGMEGKKYGHTNYDLDRYERLLDVSCDMKKFWDGAGSKTLDLPAKSFEELADWLKKDALDTSAGSCCPGA
jgi:hypothetical protein